MAHKVNVRLRLDGDVNDDPFYSESNIRYLEGIVNDIKKVKHILQNMT